MKKLVQALMMRGQPYPEGNMLAQTGKPYPEGDMLGQLPQMQAQRQQYINEIHRRGGQGNSQGFAQKLHEQEALIRKFRGGR